MSQNRHAQSIVLGLFFLGGYALWRTRLSYDPMAPTFDFEKSPATRHMVELHRRVDKQALAAWLAEEEAAERAAARPAAPASGKSA